VRSQNPTRASINGISINTPTTAGQRRAGRQAKQHYHLGNGDFEVVGGTYHRQQRGVSASVSASGGKDC
jgi:hypothetical protein